MEQGGFGRGVDGMVGMDCTWMAAGCTGTDGCDPVERCYDLQALSEIEPDILLADRWSAQFGLATLPYDLIDQSEMETRRRIAGLDRRDMAAFHAHLRAMRAQAFARAIAWCQQAEAARETAIAQRRQAQSCRDHEARGVLAGRADRAERAAAMFGLDALRAAHHARGVDAAVSLTLIGIGYALPFGMVGPMPMPHAHGR